MPKKLQADKKPSSDRQEEEGMGGKGGKKSRAENLLCGC